MFNIFQSSAPKVSAEEVYQALSKKEQLVLLDVRTPEEFAKNRIKGSINIPVDEIDNQITKTITDKKQKVYVYCFSGSRSDVTVNTMIKLGYTNVFSMTSGLLAWRMKKYSLEG